MDAGRIAGSVINTAVGTEYTAKAAETRPERNTTAPTQQWDMSCMLQISNEGYHKYAQTKEDAVGTVQTTVTQPVITKKNHTLEDAMTNLARFAEEQERMLGDTASASSTIEQELRDAWDLARQESSASDTDSDAESQAADIAESKAAIRRKLQQLSRGIRKSSLGADVTTVNTVYSEARKNLTLAKQEDHVLRNNLSALYRYVIQDDNLSVKDRADAINRFVAEGRQTLSRIERSLNYSLTQMRNIQNIRQARQDMVSTDTEQDFLLNAN